MLRRELEPGQEVERLTEVPAVVQPPGDRREVVEPGRNVARALLEDPAALVLRQLPPGVCLRDGDERGASRVLAAKRFLLGKQRVVLAARDITLVACHAAQDPRQTPAEAASGGALDYFKLGHWFQWRANHRLKALHRPPSIVCTSKGHQQRAHVGSLRALADPTCAVVSARDPQLRKPIKMVDHAQGWQAACRRFGRNGLLP
jgi:hypothetical protein